ncbi:hypothetical protein ACOME3_006020 [Neoechinorhynchus agilis]
MSTPRRKVLLMGKSGSGKTSMRSIIFANGMARDTRRLGPTIDVEQTYVRFLNCIVNLWDCGGQEAFIKEYFTSQKSVVFKEAEVLIYVFDIESKEHEDDINCFRMCLDRIRENSPNAKIFCLVHKMDLVPAVDKETVFQSMETELKGLTAVDQGRAEPCKCFPTSIWDETLYKAWSQIVYMLIPNMALLERKLQNFADLLDADEVLLFERATFLVISQCTRTMHRDINRFEKISSIIKQFKQSCTKLATSFQCMEVRNSMFCAFIESFTQNTYVMVITSSPSSGGMTVVNIRNARKYFGKIER